MKNVIEMQQEAVTNLETSTRDNKGKLALYKNKIYRVVGESNRNGQARVSLEFISTGIGDKRPAIFEVRLVEVDFISESTLQLKRCHLCAGQIQPQDEIKLDRMHFNKVACLDAWQNGLKARL